MGRRLRIHRITHISRIFTFGIYGGHHPRACRSTGATANTAFMIDGNTAFFLLPGNRTNRADVHALRLFALSAGVRGIVEIAIQAAARANPVVAKEIIAMDFDTGEECPY